MINDKLFPVKLYVAQTETGFSCGIIDEKLYNSNDYYISLALAKGMLRLVLQNPDMVFDEGIMAMGEEMETEEHLDFEKFLEKRRSKLN